MAETNSSFDLSLIDGYKNGAVTTPLRCEKCKVPIKFDEEQAFNLCPKCERRIRSIEGRAALRSPVVKK
jgi:hypothetical protein